MGKCVPLDVTEKKITLNSHTVKKKDMFTLNVRLRLEIHRNDTIHFQFSTGIINNHLIFKLDFYNFMQLS